MIIKRLRIYFLKKQRTNKTLLFFASSKKYKVLHKSIRAKEYPVVQIFKKIVKKLSFKIDPIIFVIKVVYIVI